MQNFFIEKMMQINQFAYYIRFSFIISFLDYEKKTISLMNHKPKQIDKAYILLLHKHKLTFTNNIKVFIVNFD